MRSLESRQWKTGNFNLGTGVTGSTAIIAGVAGKILVITYVTVQRSVSAAQAMVIESTVTNVALLSLAASGAVGSYPLGPLFQGVALPVGEGVQVTVGGAGNAANIVVEGYYDS